MEEKLEGNEWRITIGTFGVGIGVEYLVAYGT